MAGCEGIYMQSFWLLPKLLKQPIRVGRIYGWNAILNQWSQPLRMSRQSHGRLRKNAVWLTKSMNFVVGYIYCEDNSFAKRLVSHASIIQVLEFLINLIKYQMSTKTRYIRLSRGFKGYLDSQSLINTQRNPTTVTNNWFNDLPQPNYIFPYGTFLFSSDEEMRNYFLIWCIGDHNHVLGFNLLGFSLSPNGPNWFPLIKLISIFC